MSVHTSEQGAVRDDPPVSDDCGLVVRPIGGGGGGAIPVAPPPTIGVVTSVAGSLVSVVILAANPLRIGFSVRNQAESAYLYLLANTAGGAASPTNHTVALPPGGYYEDPYRYVGVVSGVWDATLVGGDIALVDEYTPIP